MKVVILAGGFGTRISEESAFGPKAMIEIGSMPILWLYHENICRLVAITNLSSAQASSSM